MSTDKRVTVYHLIDRRFVGIVDNGQRVMIDGEKTARTGMGPMDLLLNALGACAAYEIVGMLGKRRLAISDYHIELTGERADSIPSYYTHIHAKHVFTVAGLDRRTANHFVDLAMNKYCSVAASLKAEIDFEAVLVECGKNEAR